MNWREDSVAPSGGITSRSMRIPRRNIPLLQANVIAQAGGPRVVVAAIGLVNNENAIIANRLRWWALRLEPGIDSRP